MNQLEEYAIAAKYYAGEAWNCKKLVSFGSMSIAAVEYINKCIGGGKLTARQRENVHEAIKLVVVVNNYWDEKFLAQDEYRIRRRVVRQNGVSKDYRSYYRDIASIEKTRPDPRSAKTDEIFRYREQMNAVSLAGVCAMAELGRYGDFVGSDKAIKPDAKIWFKDLWNIVMALQVVDDQMGWVGDIKNNRPTFYTALALGSGLPRKEIVPILNLKWRAYLARVEKEDGGLRMEPLMTAVGIMGLVLPTYYEILRRVPGGTKFMKGREKNEG